MSAPATSGLTRVATYRRRVRAPLERVWENVHDWEHLPWLHRESFCAIECLDSGPWGWRAKIGLQPERAGREIELELVREPDEPRYVSRTLAGPGAKSEIWTRLEERGDATDIEVEFWLPDVRPEQKDALGAAFTALYTRLWDEDESMMLRRGDLLARPPGPAAAADTVTKLGPLAALRARLPLVVHHAGRPWRIVEHQGALLAHATVCPHMLGPLEDAPLDDDGCLTCPWHGYRFHAATGKSADGHRLRLPAAPRVQIDPNGEVVLRP